MTDTAAVPLPEPITATQASSARDASIGGAIRLAAELAVRLSSVIATLWLTRSLGVTSFGDFLLALSMGLMIGDLCDLGLNAIIVPQVIRDVSSVRTLLKLKATLTLVVLLLCFVLIPLASYASGVALSLITLSTLHFFGASWIDAAGTSLRALGRRVDEAVLLLVFRSTLVILVLTAPFGLTVAGAARSYAIAIVPALLLSVVLISKPIASLSRAVLSSRAILSLAIPMGLNSYLAIMSTRVELFLLQASFGPQAVGLFGGALRIVESLLTLPSAVAAGALPAVSRDVVSGSRGAAQRTFGLIVWIAAPCAVGIAVCAPGVLGVLGPGFVDAASSLRVLSAALFLCFSNAALFHILIAAADTSRVPRLTAMRVGVAIIAGLILIPRLGAMGAALSFTAAEGCLFLALIRNARRHADLNVARPTSWALLACAPMALVLPAINLALPLAILAGALLFVVAAGLISLRGSEAAGLA